MSQLKRIGKDLKDVQSNDNPNIEVTTADDDITHWEVTIHGPANSPFQGGLFKVSIDMSQNFPFKPPKVKIETKVYHPNIDDNGAVCLPILKEEHWKPTNKMNDVLLSLFDILETPNPNDPIQNEVAQVYMTNKDEFLKTAKEWTAKYAK